MVGIPDDMRPIVDLGIQMVVGAVVFVVIGLIALLLSLFVKWLERMGAPDWLATTTHYLEIAVYGLDVLCFALFLVNEARKFIRKLDWSS